MPTRKRNSKPRSFRRRLIIGGDVTQEEIDKMITKVEDLTKEIIELKNRIREKNGIQLESENSLATQKTVESAASTNNEIDTEVNASAVNPLALQIPTESLSENNEGANTGASTNYESDIEQWTKSLPPTPHGNAPQFKETVFTQDIKDSLPGSVRGKYNTLNSIIQRANEKRGMFEKRRDQDKANQVDALAKSLKKINTKEGLMNLLNDGKFSSSLEVLKGGAKTRKRKQKKQRRTNKRR